MLSTVVADDWNSPCTQRLGQQRTNSLWRQFSVVPVLERTDHVFLAGSTIASPGPGLAHHKLRRREVGRTYSLFQAIKSKLNERAVKYIITRRKTKQFRMSTASRTKNYKSFRSLDNDPNSNLLNTDLLRFVINNWWHCAVTWKKLTHFCSWKDTSLSRYNNACLKIDSFLVNRRKKQTKAPASISRKIHHR